MSADRWEEIEELFLRGLHASEATRCQILEDIREPHVIAAVTQLWDDAAGAPSQFLADQTEPSGGEPYRVGDVVEDRFRLDRLLGTGGMGQVFGAFDIQLDRHVALKFLNTRFARHPVMRGLLGREARAVCRLADHPNICTVHDLRWDGEKPFLVMELLAGETLAARVRRGPLPVKEAVAIGLGIADGLAYAHDRDVVHRDLKPGNVMLTPFGPKLFDFGIAKRVDPAMLGDASILAPPGAFVGSVSYSSPEQAEGTAIDARSDIFSAGAVLYEMATGAKAFEAATRLSTLAAVLRGDPKPMQDLNPSVPVEYVRIVARCLEKDPSRRFQTTADLRAALDRLARSGFDRTDHAFDRVASRAGLRARLGHLFPGQSRAAAGAPPARTGRPGAVPSGLAQGLLARRSRHPVCIFLSLSYGAMVGLALLAEIAYEWQTFGAWALPISLITGVASMGVSLVALATLLRRVASQRSRGLAVTLGIFIGWSLTLAAMLAPQLPDRALVRATFQTMTASVGYPKSLLEALALPVLTIVPLQVVCALEGELRRGRAERVYRALTSAHQALSIPGTVVVRPITASVVFAVVTIWWISANAHLLESLETGPYYSLFLEIAIVRAASGLLMLFAVLVWYTWTLNDITLLAQEEAGITTHASAP